MVVRSYFSKVLSGSLLIAGTAIGAGMLGIPLVTAQAGFIPAFLITTTVWLFMLMTGLLLLEATFWMKENTSFLSISERFLGKTGRFFTLVMFLFLYFSLMVAYFAAGAPLFGTFAEMLFGFKIEGLLLYVIFGLIFGVIVAIGPKSIDRANLILTLVMCAIWIALIILGSNYVKMDYLKTKAISSVWLSTPILFGAFGYHNIIPSLSTYFHHDKKALRASIFIGTSIPYVVYLFWQWLIMGTVDSNTILATSKLGLPITFALKAVTQNPYVPLLGQLFAFFAIITSTLGVAFSLVDFIADGLKKKPIGIRRIGITAVVFLFPMIFSFVDPTIFEKALGIAGGFGESFLNGLLPISVYFVGYHLLKLKHAVLAFSKQSLYMLSTFCFFVILIEVYQLFF